MIEYKELKNICLKHGILVENNENYLLSSDMSSLIIKQKNILNMAKCDIDNNQMRLPYTELVEVTFYFNMKNINKEILYGIFSVLGIQKILLLLSIGKINFDLWFSISYESFNGENFRKVKYSIPISLVSKFFSIIESKSDRVFDYDIPVMTKLLSYACVYELVINDYF